ncbi:MAG TPA: DUF3293 domain-containing protein [Dokdonella sp.]|uniref:DUF3293 domain-containing protein n=1 Tax=Dokdonella sp. TaxID=2291710 RepID=UPI002C34839A|nr:DUF3293 domain-containing protein [Dokdonella sp.]HUD43799.1 DUF3293 domain-containing protein [Dokdonella sp.]
MNAGAAAAQVLRLLALYRSAGYAVRLPGGRRAVLGVDAMPPPSLVQWLSGATGALLTACNPGSRPLPARENRRRLRQLHHDLTDAHARLLPASGYGPDWREASLFAAGVPLGQIDVLAERYGQNAIVVVEPDRPVRLRIYRGDWMQA